MTSKGSSKPFRRIQRPADDSSSSEDEFSTPKENSFEFQQKSSQELSEESDIEIPPTDDEDDEEVPSPANKTKLRKTLSLEVESDEEDLRRQTTYLAESDEDEKPAKEDAWALSRATRRSINPLDPTLAEGSDESEDDEDFVENSDDENSVENSISEISDDPDVSDVKSVEKSLHSNSGFIDNEAQDSKDSFHNVSADTEHDLSESREVSNTSIPVDSIMPGSSKRNNDIVDISDDEDVKVEKRRVSRSDYNAQLAHKEKLENDLKNLLKLQDHSKNLPDGGAKLGSKIQQLIQEIESHSKLMQTLAIDENLNLKKELTKNIAASINVSGSDDEVIPVETYIRVDDVKPKHFGKVGLQNFEHRKAETVKTIQEIHQSISDRPTEEDLDDPPKYLKVELKKHQLHALKFMRWREDQKFRGGILADDMGLGKTLTSISLILRQIQIDEDKEEDSEESEDDENGEEQWKTKGRRDLYPGGTLVVCPAAVVMQWEGEIKSKVKRGALDHNVFHGAKRIYKARELAQFDIVITSYQTVASEFKNNGCLFKVKFRRIILDEGHIIRNHQTQNSKAVCELHGSRRWVLSGTPVQNKEFDLFAVVKFLRIRPFNDLTYWKQFVEVRSNKSCSSPRVQTLLKSILLRRTKEELKELEPLPGKEVKLVNFELNKEERFVYNRLMAYSKTIFAQYLDQQDKKNSDYRYDQTRLQRTYNQFARKYKSDNDEIKSHEILVLLLRLRQACCHSGLLREMVENNTLDCQEMNHSTGDADTSDIAKELEKMNLHGDGDSWNTDNEIFDLEEPSSKVKQMMITLREEIAKGNKIVVVSQWTAYLGIIRTIIGRENISYCEFNGTVAVKDRNKIVEQFNDPNSSVKVMLLSLTCGGVGINLVGANVMFIMDLHWNPQLEKQGQDRIYRFGQKKEVTIYKFVCDSTIEERVLQLQDSKLQVAESALTGAKNVGNKLTMNDLKLLFDIADN